MNIKELNIIATSQPSLSEARDKNKKKIRLFRNIYAITLFILIGISLLTLVFDTATQKKYSALFATVEITVLAALIGDYAFRWYTAPARFSSKTKGLVFFPFSIISILLLASLVPSFYIIGNHLPANDPAAKVFQQMQNYKFLRVIRIVLLANLFPPLAIFKRVIEKNKWTLYNVLLIVIITIVIFSLVILNAERDVTGSKITSFKDALYFSTITLTTIGFGDLTPITSTGRIIVMIMSIVGIGILAIPSGIIAGGFLTEAKKLHTEKKKDKKVTKK